MEKSLAKLKNTLYKMKLRPTSIFKHDLSSQLRASLVDIPSDYSSESDSSSAHFCRICFSKEGALISPCHCKGSLGYVHEHCLIQWLVASSRKKCELCQAQIQLYEERLSLKEIIKRTFAYLKEDKKRCLYILAYFVYLWILKYKLFSLLGVYFKTLLKMSPIRMFKTIYHLFILMLILELAFEEYGRIKAVIQFFRKISVSLRIKNLRKNHKK